MSKEDWKNDRAEAAMHEEEMKNMAKSAAEYKKNHPKKMTASELEEKINDWEADAGESFTDYFMHDNVKDNSWAFWLLGKGFTERANEIIDEILKGETCLDQGLLYDVHTNYDDDFKEIGDWKENSDKNVKLWAEFLVSTPFYLDKITEFFKKEEEKND